MEYVKINNITTVVTGGTPSTTKKEYWEQGTIPWLQSGCCQNCDVIEAEKYITQLGYDNSSTKMMPKDTIMIALTGATAGKIGYLQFEACGNQSITGILPNEKLNQRYLYYYLISKRSKILSDCIGGAQPHISQGYVKNIEIPLYGIEEQNKIVRTLNKVKSIITHRRTQLEKLDLLVKARFVEMFGDPELNPYNLPAVNLAELSELITKGASPSWQGFSYTDDNSQTLFITSENVREGFVDISSPKYVEDGFNEKQKRSMIHKGDFLINIVGASIGRAAQFNLECKANMNQASALVRVNDNRIRDKYLLMYLNSDKAQLMYDSMKSDTGRANLSLQDIGNLTILLPSIQSQIEFENFVKQVDKSKATVQKALDEAQLLFDSLMQEYFG